MLRSLLTMIFIFIIYFFTKNIMIVLVGSIAVILIMKSLEPYLKLLESKLCPMLPVKTMRDLRPVTEPGRGVRILVITQFTEFDPNDAESTQLYERIMDDAVNALRQSSPLFGLRYEAVCKRRLPMQYTYAICGEKDSGVTRCFNSWMKSINAKDFGICKRDTDLFIHDGFFNDPVTGEERSSVVLFLFDGRLPKTIADKKSGQAGDVQNF
jgi:hypothetical protein